VAGALPDLDGDRLSGLEELLSRATVRELLEAYLINGEQRVLDIRDHAADCDFVAMGETAHALVGMAGNLGIAHVGELAALIEQACKNGQTDRVIQLAIGLPEAHTAAVAAIRDWFVARSPATDNVEALEGA
jgi:HPt (histidine-containing phosphotransfer) domain-containing protein